eukprot:g3784.t1
MKKVCILGGGVSGLSTAWFLRAAVGRSIEIDLFESSSRFGGWVRTSSDNKDGFVFEHGPRGFRPNGNGVEALRLIEKLGIQNEAICTAPTGNDRFVWFNGRLNKLPGSLSALLRSPLAWRVLIPAILKEPWVSRRTASGEESEDDESVFDFISRRFSPSVAELFIDAMVSGIYAGDSSTLSVRSCFPLLYRLEKDHGSVIRGIFAERGSSGKELLASDSEWIRNTSKKVQVSFRKGMQTLIDTLVEKLSLSSTTKLRSNCKVKELKRSASGDKFEVVMEGGVNDHLQYDYVISTLPADVLASLLLGESEAEKQLHNSLLDVSQGGHASVAVVNLGFQGKLLGKKSADERSASDNDLFADFMDSDSSGKNSLTSTTIKNARLSYQFDGKLLQGFGYLVPRREKENVLGMTWDSLVFPQQDENCDGTRVTVMMGGSRHPEIATKGPITPCSQGNAKAESLRDLAMNVVERHLGPYLVKSQAATTSIKHVPCTTLPEPSSWSAFSAVHCIPQYQVGHAARVLAAENAVKEWSKPVSKRMKMEGREDEKWKESDEVNAEADDAFKVFMGETSSTEEAGAQGQLRIIGTSFYGVGIADCISRAKTVSEEVARELNKM